MQAQVLHLHPRSKFSYALPVELSSLPAEVAPQHFSARPLPLYSKRGPALREVLPSTHHNWDKDQERDAPKSQNCRLDSYCTHRRHVSSASSCVQPGHHHTLGTRPLSYS